MPATGGPEVAEQPLQAGDGPNQSSREIVYLSSTALSFANASCAHCARLVTQVLQGQEGIRSVEVDRVRLRVYVDFDPTQISLEAIRGLMERSGYPTQVAEEDSSDLRLPTPSRAA